MSRKGKSLAGWTQTRNTIWENWNTNHLLRRPLSFSKNPNSDYQKYTKNMEALEAQSVRHFDTGLRIVDEKAAKAKVIGKLKEASQEAKRETDKIATATQKLKQATDVVNMVTKVVEAFTKVMV